MEVAVSWVLSNIFKIIYVSDGQARALLHAIEDTAAKDADDDGQAAAFPPSLVWSGLHRPGTED